MALLILAVAIVTFAVGTLAGYVYAHEPQAADLQTRFATRETPPQSITRGTLSIVAPGFIEVLNSAGAERYRIERDAPIEELTPFSGTIPDGAPVNVGGHRTESGFVITGVVLVPTDTR